MTPTRLALLPLLAATALSAQEPAPPLPTTDFFAGRRQALAERLRDGVVLLLADPPAPGPLPFVQGSEFYYLTGVTEPGTAMLLLPQTGEEILLVPPFNRLRRMWDGESLAPGDAAAKRTGFAQVGNVRRLDELLDRHLAAGADGKRPTLWTITAQERRGPPRRESLGAVPSRAAALGEALRERYPGLEIRSVREHTNALRGIKTTAEIEQIRRSTDVACQGIAEAMKSTEPGMHEFQVAAVARYVFTRLGAGHDAYQALVGGGPNGCILHHRAGTRVLLESDLIVMDYGGTVHGYATDVTRTFPSNGRFTPEQRKLVDDVYEIQQTLLAEVRPGASLGALSTLCRRLLFEKGYRADHGPCHHVGLEVHDQGDDLLAPGMVITVEPGAYLRDAGMGCRIEDTILITEGGHENLSAHLPSRPDEIEALMALPGIAQQPVGLPGRR
jgi:Xaa-Pro aminopeptidase